jgi:hypothetical protein
MERLNQDAKTNPVLPGSNCTKHQAIGSLPQPRAAATAPGDQLVSLTQAVLPGSGLIPHQRRFRAPLFQHPQAFTLTTGLLDRGRDTSCLVPPAQTRTGAH